MTKKSVAVIGAGFAGLAAATSLADKGHDVTVYEKNSMAGGRAREFEAEGFLFDMGPSWYWMPDVFERYFERFGKKVSDYYDLIRLDPSYRVVFGQNEHWDIPASLDEFYALFESVEPGSSVKLKKFLKEAAYKYDVGINKLVYKPGRSLRELLDPELFSGLLRLHVFSSISSYIRKHFSDPRIIQLLEFPVLFLGAMPSDTPALYSLMNYADIALGTWYPKGGMHRIVEGMKSLAEEKGVKFRFNSEVKSFQMEGNKIAAISLSDGTSGKHDYIVAGADYHHVEQHLLPKSYRKYSPEYWDSRKMAPSSLIFYLGVSKELPNLLHHNLFFDRDFGVHARLIYKEPAWPEEPLFYVCCTSKTDQSSAPEGMENVFILIPVAPGLEDTEKARDKLYTHVMDRLEQHCGTDLRKNVVYKRSYAHRDFVSDYHAFKGNAYGLANTLLQTANLKPAIFNKKVRNLYFTGQLTVPGPGVPPSLISGQVVAEEIDNAG
ncbi:phytoene desaturase family protein [Fulvivirga sedimenti]|uniref:Phytoene desaturase n=1 Tax=Fulvivirga sedimenti TaxID=2879465 RepID=A0A9X1HMD2_9BACT|nr:phytoene desaturase family protein [Fulvivirga sedimenti]MCA6073660.1 phytoene desaturase [Fulvivirga sedimenti]